MKSHDKISGAKPRFESSFGRPDLYIVAGLTVSAAIIRALGLFSNPIDLDEGYTALMAKLGLVEPLLRGPCDRNPIAAHIPHAVWASLFGGSQNSLEIVSFLAGVAIIPIVYLLGRELFNRRTGLISAGLVSFSTFHIFYSQYIRIYSVAALVTTSGLLFFSRWLTSRRRLDGAAALFLGAAAINLHYYAALFTGSIFLFLAGLAISDKKVRRPAVVSGIVIILASLPTIIWQARVLNELKEPTWMASPGLKTFASIWFHLSSQSIPLMIILLSSFFIAVYQALRLKTFNRRLGLILTGIFIPVLVPLIFSLGHGSVFHLRYFIFISVPFLVVAAHGLSCLEPAIVRRSLVVIVFALAIAADRKDYLTRRDDRTSRPSSLLGTPAEAAVKSEDSALLFTSKCGFVSAQVASLSYAPSYLLKSSDDTWVLNCIAGKQIEVAEDSLSRFKNIVVVNQGCPPTPARTEMCRDDAFAKLGFKKTATWKNGAVCEFVR